MLEVDVAESDDAKEEVICEFFGIKIKTKNANLARILTTDVHEVLNLDVKEISAFIKGEQKTAAEELENEDAPEEEQQQEEKANAEEAPFSSEVEDY